MTVRGFDSYEDMQAYMAEQEARALEWIKPFQRPLADGKKHHFLRLVALGADILLIAGETFDLDQHRAEMLERYGTDKEGRAEVEAEIKERWASLPRGFVLTRAFSEVEPRGEVGDTHIATMLPISDQDFTVLAGMGFSISQAVQNLETRQLMIRWVQLVGIQ